MPTPPSVDALDPMPRMSRVAPASTAALIASPNPCVWADRGRNSSPRSSIPEVDASSTFGLVGDTSGGLYDVALAVGYPVRRDVDVYANLRLLGGGAEVPAQAIDNWANFVSAAIGVRLTLRP